jgi:hypothetical protein
LNESTSNAANTYIFLINKGGAYFSLNSCAIYANIFADSVFLFAFLYNSTASIFLFFSSKELAYFPNSCSICKKLCCSANSTA